MAIITPSTSIIFGQFSWGQETFDLGEASESDGSTSARLMGFPKWRVSAMSPRMMSEAQAGIWIPTLLQLRGLINHLEMWDVGRPAPLGTMRGTMTLNGSHSAGVTSISVTAGAGESGKTLEAMDLLQIGTGLSRQVVMVMSQATANGSGVINLTIEPPLRIAFTGGTAVAWDKPKATFKMISKLPAWAYEPGYNTKGSIPLELIEDWS